MQLRYLSVFLLVLFSCQSPKEEWQTLDAGKFRIKAPKDWWIAKMRGIDSHAGAVLNDHDTLTFSYGGYYTEVLDDSNAYKQAIDTINGFTAIITIPEVPGKGNIAVRIMGDTASSALTLWSNHVSSTEVVLKMFKSIRFTNSDTSLNPALSADKFEPFRKEYSGKRLFQTNCATCHQIWKKTIGPPLHNIAERKGLDSVYWLLTDSSAVAKQLHPVRYEALTKAEILLILAYTGN